MPTGDGSNTGNGTDSPGGATTTTTTTTTITTTTVTTTSPPGGGPDQPTDGTPAADQARKTGAPGAPK